MGQTTPRILFTAFEPSGDEHAAPVIAALRRRRPELSIHAFGGPRMAEAGASLIEPTTGRAAMGAAGLMKIAEQLRLRRRLSDWLAEHPVSVHVPTDSPAANWGMVEQVRLSPYRYARRHGVWPGRPRIVHLVAPQVWAWASWRVRRLRATRCGSDLVLCLLPFEPAWFQPRGVNARFIGHPLFDRPIDAARLEARAADFPAGRPRLALLPGSRPAEVEAHWPDMAACCERLRRRFSKLAVVAAPTDEAAAERLRALGGCDGASLHIAPGRMDAAIHWADAVLTVSGTASLHVARLRTPMTILYRVHPLAWHGVGRWLVDTRTFALPNLIAAGGPDPRMTTTEQRDRHVVREFIPFNGDLDSLAEEVDRLLTDARYRRRQIEALERVCRAFEGRAAGEEAAAAIVEQLEGRSDEATERRSDEGAECLEPR